MKAIYLVRHGNADHAFAVREVPLPVPTENQTRVKVEAFGLNFADVMARKGMYQDCPPLPCVLGYDVVGTIDEVGNNVSNVKIGDRVTAFTRFGGYAQYVLVDALGVALIPHEMPLTFAGALATQYCTAYYAAYECVNVFPGDYALVHAAAGGVGTALVQLLKPKGAIVFGTCGSEEKINYLRTLGVDHPINYRMSDYKEVIGKTLGKERLDVIFDSIGGKYVRDGIRLLGAGGKMICYGAAELSGASNIFSKARIALQFGFYHPASFITKSKSLIGVYMLPLGDYKPRTIHRCLQAVVKLAKEGTITSAGGMDFPVEQLAIAHEALEKRRTMGKVMVKW